MGRARILLIRAAPADTMVLFGDVGQMEELRERPGDRQRFIERHPSEHVGQFAERALVAGTAALGQRAGTLDDIEHILAGKPLHCLAEQLTEQAHIVAQRLVRIGVHFSTIPQGR